MLIKGGQVWIGWIGLAPETLLGRASAWLCAQYIADTKAFYTAVRAGRHVATRIRGGRPPRRFELIWETLGERSGGESSGRAPSAHPAVSRNP